ncbi:BON domain protein [Maioricimonas rarisocia]|uniref:BON domain protein n=1 Tax=Maioricimonas rarisocia TaxID=2528026 RepID=A0A517Z841_9PLAN|nr:BON domain-containing protein [Maioricimonas rarisocia]QDU38644.1 BON domain protein [Maioricimonas rarisocia]
MVLATGTSDYPASASQVPTLICRVQAELERNSYLSHRPIQCVRENETVVLQGTVQTYFEKQMAQTVAAGVDGIERVINKIEVTRDHDPTS